LVNLGMNLNITIVDEYHDVVHPGSVIRTEPAEGVELNIDQEIVLYVSLGVEEKTGTMPNLVGDTQINAVKRLESKDMKLQIVTEEIFDSLAPEGEVVKTEPELGGTLVTGQKVVLYISKGPNLKKMQQLVGLNVDAAVSLLKMEEFNNYQIEPVVSDKQPGIVVEQSEPADTMVDVNTVIILKYSKGPISKSVTVNVPTQAELAECGITEDLYTAEDGTVSFVVTIRQGNTVCFTSESLNFSSAAVSFTFESAGTQEFEVYINGHLFKKIAVEFTE